jgi:hypothetical protein
VHHDAPGGQKELQHGGHAVAREGAGDDSPDDLKSEAKMNITSGSDKIVGDDYLAVLACLHHRRIDVEEDRSSLGKKVLYNVSMTMCT